MHPMRDDLTDTHLPPVMPDDPGVPENADESGMTRAELLAAAQLNYLRWARTATTDEPPAGFNRQFARSDAYFAEVLRRRDAERAGQEAADSASTGEGTSGDG